MCFFRVCFFYYCFVKYLLLQLYTRRRNWHSWLKSDLVILVSHFLVGTGIYFNQFQFFKQAKSFRNSNSCSICHVIRLYMILKCYNWRWSNSITHFCVSFNMFSRINLLIMEYAYELLPYKSHLKNSCFQKESGFYYS